MLLLSAFLLFMPQTPSNFVEGKIAKPGFFDLYWDGEKGNLFMAVQHLDTPFLLVTSIPTGLGSNDIGLDRGRLGMNVLVQFERVGTRLYLVQPNLNYRAQSDNPAEVRAVTESFAPSTLWSSEIVAEEDGRLFIDMAGFVFKDQNEMISGMKSNGGGSYAVDKERSRYFLNKIKSFPDNTEIEVTLTLTGEPSGDQVRAVSADPRSPQINQRISFIRLPEQGYEARPFHPSCGGFDFAWKDYAAPLDSDLTKLWLMRHRLSRNAKTGEVVKPLIYYVDHGAPKDIRDALLEGASWWSQAFEAAGFKNAFQVKVMPPDVDPMDVRFNVIQWVHRVTRGWSYGSTIYDPRTGEIIKGQVTLGSLRVRQDRLIFEGMVPRSPDGNFPSGQDPSELALARIRQLAAHEVGHTLGLAHNFIASTQGRASVMDYPAPLVRMKNGNLDTSNVYARDIGAWDKVSIRCLYEEFEHPAEAIESILAEARQQGLTFITDQDSRSSSSMHPDSHLWDNGADVLDEMAKIIEARQYMIEHFSSANMAADHVQARLEEVFVPVYLHHRYQLEAVTRSLGGINYDYGFNDGKRHLTPVTAVRQRQAMELVLKTLSPHFLQVPKAVCDLIPPRPPGYDAHREMFDRRTGVAFDVMALPETSVQLTLDLLLDPARLNRIFAQQLNQGESFTLMNFLDGLAQGFQYRQPGSEGMLQRQVNHLVLNALITSLGQDKLREEVRAQIAFKLKQLDATFAKPETDPLWQAHLDWLHKRLESVALTPYGPSRLLKIPPGSPI